MSHPNFCAVSFAATCCIEISRRYVISCLSRRVVLDFVSAARGARAYERALDGAPDGAADGAPDGAVDVAAQPLP